MAYALTGDARASLVQFAPGELSVHGLMITIGRIAIYYSRCFGFAIYRVPLWIEDHVVAYYARGSDSSLNTRRSLNASRLVRPGDEEICIMGGADIPQQAIQNCKASGSPWDGINEVLGALPPKLAPQCPIDISVKLDTVRTWLSCLKQDVPQDDRQTKLSIGDRLLNLSRESGSRKVSELADELGMSRRTLQLKSVEQFGVAPKGLLRGQALSLSASMISKFLDTRRIGDIAFECGYENFAQFCADYRALFGETPTETVKRLESLKADRATWQGVPPLGGI
jgi:AraC-like DNA-binding protein